MCILILLGGIVLFLIILLCWLQEYEGCYWSDKCVPHVRPIPFISQKIATLLRRPCFVEYMQSCYDMIPSEARYYGFYEFGRPVVILKDALLAQSLMVEKFDYFSEHVLEATYCYSEPLMRQCIYKLNGDKWKEMRQTMEQFFSASVQNAQFDLMRKRAAGFARYLRDNAIDTSDLDVLDALARYTVEVTTGVVFGCTVDELHEKRDDRTRTMAETWKYFTARGNFWMSMSKLQIVRRYPALARMLGINLGQTSGNRFFRGLIQEVIRRREERNECSGDLIDLLRTAQDNETGAHELNMDDITAQAISFYFLNRSVTLAVGYALYALAKDATCREKLTKEIDEALLASADNGITREALDGMVYLDMVIRETLRRYTTIPAVERVCTKPCVLSPACEGYKSFTVPVGMSIWIPIQAIQKDRRYFERPDTFDPERFDPSKPDDCRASFAYCPWGQGPRYCFAKDFVVREMKTILVYLLSDYRVDLTPRMRAQRAMKLDSNDFFPEPRNSIRLCLTRRTT